MRMRRAGGAAPLCATLALRMPATVADVIALAAAQLRATSARWGAVPRLMCAVRGARCVCAVADNALKQWSGVNETRETTIALLQSDAARCGRALPQRGRRGCELGHHRARRARRRDGGAGGAGAGPSRPFLRLLLISYQDYHML